MSLVVQQRTMELPLETVWAALDDFGNIDRWHYNAAASDLLSPNNEGLGATRRVRMNNGSEVTERIVEYEAGVFTRAEVVEHDLPLHPATLTFRVVEASASSTEVTVEMEFDMKFGPLGWVLDKLMMTPSMRKSLALVLAGLEEHLRTGKAIGTDGRPVD